MNTEQMQITACHTTDPNWQNKYNYNQAKMKKKYFTKTNKYLLINKHILYLKSLSTKV